MSARNLVAAVAIGLCAGWLPTHAAASEPVELMVQDIPASELVGLLYREVLRRPFVTAPSVQAERSLVSAHIQGSQEDARAQASDYLQALGFVINEARGVDRVELPAPIVQKVEPPMPSFPFSYRPKYRDPSALAEVLRPMFPDARFSGSSASSGEAVSQTDTFVAHASRKDLAQIEALLPRIDTPLVDLVVKAAVFEVSTSADDGSAFQLALDLLDGQVNLGVGALAAAGGDPSSLPALLGSFLSVSSSSIEAVAQSLSRDSRFNLVTSPSVRAQAGAVTTFNVGQSVPVLGAVSYGRDAGPVQSVDYRDAGVIFSVRPFVRDQVISMELKQEISDFVLTTTGVNNTPTLTRRSLETTLSTQDGDVIMLGGLTQNKDGGAKEGFSFLPDFLKTNRDTSSRTDLLLVLQVVRMTSSPSVDMALSKSAIPVDPARFGAVSEASPVPLSPQAAEAIRRGAPGLF